MSNRKKIIVCSLALLCVFVLGIAVHANLIIFPFVRSIEVRLIDGLDDDRVLVGVSHVVFVGKITKKIGQTAGETGPLTQYEVQVIQNIKGTLVGSVILNQEGGYENGILSLVEGQSLLRVGTTYILSARTDGNGNYLVIPHPRGRIVVTTKSNLSLEKLISLAVADKNMIAMQNAYIHEIPFQIDIDKGNNFNSYESSQTK